ncbi:hypothetical protein KUTeg_010077 [Tegillarca granosa]|uniref:Uncharacterized protein n=1 Tax=Tegillarca granosa TaxID=220873 RepID=A0ABQ9F5V1_TEGGR|nr:hypothetical protein KUTeg_010077 [Tegillarca granosa]
MTLFNQRKCVGHLQWTRSHYLFEKGKGILLIISFRNIGIRNDHETGQIFLDSCGQLWYFSQVISPDRLDSVSHCCIHIVHKTFYRMILIHFFITCNSLYVSKVSKEHVRHFLHILSF